MAQTSAEIQKEYNEVLKVSQSLTGALNAMVDDTAKSQKNLSDRAKEYNTNLKSIFTSAQDIESVDDAILAAEKLKGELAERYWGANKKLLPTKEAEAEVGIDILKTEKKRLQVVKQVDDTQQKLTDSINGSLDGLLSGLEEIPVIGKAMSGLASGPVNYLKSSVSDAGKTFTNSFSAATKNGMSGMKAFASAGSASMSSLAASLAGPQAIIAVIVAIAAAGIIAFYKVSAAAKSFRKETGLLNSQTGDLESKFANVASSTAEFGGNIEQASSAASTFSNQMKGTQQASEAVLTSMVAMENSFGVSIDAQAKVNEQFQLMSGVSADTAQSMIQTVIAAADVAKVSPAAVMQDMAENAEAGMMFFQGSAKALALAAIEARKMGTSIGETTKVAEGLLDFESSITKELELGAMLGTRVNFNKARALAFEGDMIGMQQAVNKEVGKLGDINKMNMYQKKALTEATGMDLKSLIKQQKIAKTLPGLKKEELAAANALLDTGMDIADISKGDLKRKAIEMGNQKKMQSSFDNMGNSLKAIGTELLMAFMPIGEFLIGTLEFFMPLIRGFIKPIQLAIGRVMEAFAPLSEMFSDMFGGDEAGDFSGIMEAIGGTLSIVFSALSYGINVMARNLKGVSQIIGGVWKIIKGIFTMDFSMIGDGLYDAFSGIGNIILSPILGLWDTISDVVGMWVDGIATLFGSLSDRVKGFVMAMLPAWAVSLLTDDNTTASQEASNLQVAGSIDDGIVQDGNIISTNPEDTLIATKTPESLFGESMFGKIMSASPLGMAANSVNESTGGGVSNVVGGIGEMIGGLFGGDSGDSQIGAKLDELIIVMKANKDIFMDGKKVTAGVSSTVDKIGSNSYSIV
jgi:hypothetical protein